MAFEWLFGTQSSAIQAKTLESFLSIVRSYPIAFFGTLLVGSGFILYRKLKSTRQKRNDNLMNLQSRLLIDLGKKMLKLENEFDQFKIKLDQQSEAIGQILQWQKVAFVALGDSIHGIKKSIDNSKGDLPKLKPSPSTSRKI